MRRGAALGQRQADIDVFTICSLNINTSTYSYQHRAGTPPHRFDSGHECHADRPIMTRELLCTSRVNEPVIY